MKYESLFISDTHLLNKKAQAELLRKVLKEKIRVNKIFILGDFIDFWRLQLNSLSKIEQQNHLNIIQTLMKLAKSGVEIYWVIGNHDELIMKFTGGPINFGHFHILEEHIHITKNGTKILLIHGHQFDALVRGSRFLARWGDYGYHFAIWLNKWFNRLRRLLGLKYWSLSKYIKIKSKQVTTFISSFTEAVDKYRIEKECDMVMCGHIHDPCLTTRYANTGCWTDLANCTAILESFDGKLLLVKFTEGNEMEILNG